ncbi:uncharacterized protein TRIADDRAFT_51674 [Trichoplax adhaerens]|uniref:AN1-type domain-containing protein n=1 Tax=Trichoplax adhaerens TaxID=10228 RepID=B3RKG7_TRIAD|nr:hypothetical protein TRIADDRAFT_51674 [Trichoplax adhaerens]EDV29400.1 hypothetical protein TRIADDRAFT_51674 [Trichoplax adhaerens]|eukprot:XP_002108602.1 hypothetical protein TRIADDRAFT_51674 [Trichoplax adhaerens]
MEHDLLSIGRHCSVKDCNQLDFLPFTCNDCHKIFCLNHRSHVAHQCKAFADKDVKIATCPLCDKLIRRDPKLNLNDQVERHIMSGCKDNVASEGSSKSNKCSMKQCRTHELIPFKCLRCHHDYCARHRHMEDHHCHTIPVTASG